MDGGWKCGIGENPSVGASIFCRCESFSPLSSDLSGVKVLLLYLGKPEQMTHEVLDCGNAVSIRFSCWHSSFLIRTIFCPVPSLFLLTCMLIALYRLFPSVRRLVSSDFCFLPSVHRPCLCGSSSACSKNPADFLGTRCLGGGKGSKCRLGKETKMWRVKGQAQYRRGGLIFVAHFVKSAFVWRDGVEAVGGSPIHGHFRLLLSAFVPLHARYSYKTCETVTFVFLG